MTREQLLLVLAAMQLALLAPLAWLVDKHGTLPIDILLSRALQRSTSRLMRTPAVAISYTSEAILVNLLVIPAGVVLWKLHGVMQGFVQKWAICWQWFFTRR